jgi:glutathione S-transferase
MNCGVRVILNKIDDTLRADVERLSALWCEGLQRFGGPYLAGQTYTIVDAFFAPVVFRIQSYGLSLAAPAQAYVNHILALPAMRQWYDEAMREPWRKAAYEASVASYGLITADDRVKS